MKFKSVRVSVPLSPKTYALFKRYSEVTGLSMAAGVSDWLDDTSEAVEYMTNMFAQAKEKPAQAINDLKVHAEALNAGIGGLMASLKVGATGHTGQSSDCTVGPVVVPVPGTSPSPFPPHSNTGG